ncbi:unnamed protein product [Tilletia laevis]|uniref:Alkyl hydroperoxide reductase subunit C/ Thiol specific antioxidant domain-containing protein n=1 Tax=Tilletia caries TaxID=13290 RepID=A0ABN7IYU2_9BASI|nr:unnamed protein product [Tilletia caries]CAD6939685.1 unnamed protein product [Tilletia laevis]CAD6962199.1 unnamed protein product [Tilletia controversa]CAD6932110.1 unnamed protein product [Tilletia caries]CAD6981065.1 unnamed protein product [Tilletia controversa]
MVTTRSRSNPSSAAAATPAESKKTTSSSAATSKPASSKAAASKKKDAESAPADAPEDEAETTKGNKTVLDVGDSLPAETPSLVVHTSGEGEGEGDEKSTSTSLAELCTNQAKLFQENLEKFKGFTVCGCSKDKPPTQAKWHTKLNLSYNLYTDPQADTAELVGLLKSPGRKMQRGVVVVGKDGKVVGGGAYGPAPSLEAALKFVGSA